LSQAAKLQITGLSANGFPQLLDGWTKLGMSGDGLWVVILGEARKFGREALSD